MAWGARILFAAHSSIGVSYEVASSDGDSLWLQNLLRDTCTIDTGDIKTALVAGKIEAFGGFRDVRVAADFVSGAIDRFLVREEEGQDGDGDGEDEIQHCLYLRRVKNPR